MSESSSYSIARALLKNEPDLSTFLVAIFQFGAAAPAGESFSRGSLLSRVQRRDDWAGLQPRRLAELGLLRRVQSGVDGACYVTVDAVGIYTALTEHGIDPFVRLPGDFFNHVANIHVPQQKEEDEDQKPSIVWVEKDDLPPSVHRPVMTGTTPWKARTVAILAGLGILEEESGSGSRSFWQSQKSVAGRAFSLVRPLCEAGRDTRLIA
jgi:hypothetical protein